jgi:uncharacterized protein YneF (UPF0154 family)
MLLLLVLLILAVGGILIGLWITGASFKALVEAADDIVAENHRKKGRP